MKVYYYYYYLFYKKILLDPDPKLSATLGITALEGFFLTALLNLALAYFFCFDFNKYYMISLFAVLLLVNTFYFFTSTNVKETLKVKPKFFKNHRLTIIVVLLFSLLVISTLFWTGDFTNKILDKCHLGL